MAPFLELVKKFNLYSFLYPNKFSKNFYKFLISLVILGCVGLVFINWTPVVRGSGKIVALEPNARRQFIEAPVSGRIKKWHVVEGDQIKKGQLLAEIEDLDPEFLDRLNNKLSVLNSKLGILEEHKIRSEKHVNRLNKLVAKGIESKRNLELSEIELFKIITEINKIKLDLQDLDSQISRQGSQKIYSAVNGSIMSILTPVKSSIIKSGDKVAKVIPKEVKLAAALTIRGKDLALIRDNQKVRLIFEGWPAVQITGWPNSAIGTFPGIITIIDDGDDGNGNFRILVSPENNSSWPTDFIRMGIKVEGWIQLKKVPLWWEIWRQISGVPPSV